MVLKSMFMLSIYFVPMALLCSGMVHSTWWLFILYIISGLGMAGIGMGVMHDAIHGSYSKNPRVNNLMGYTMNLIGANACVWKIQHNVLHHTYTNIDKADDDINAPFFLRFSPNAKRYWIHRFQSYYIWLFYGLSTISWITAKDFIRISRYQKMGLLNGGKEYRKVLLKIIAWKLLYYSYSLVIPLIMISLHWWIIVLAFITMHFITGLLISMVFQTAHVMPGNEFPVPNENGLVANDWTIHQLATTTNFSPGNAFFSWLIGGLNYQIEHHLFPNICHIHYRKISGIVKNTAMEFNIPYNTKKTFAAGVRDHIRMLNHLGKSTNP